MSQHAAGLREDSPVPPTHSGPGRFPHTVRHFQQGRLRENRDSIKKSIFHLGIRESAGIKKKQMNLTRPLPSKRHPKVHGWVNRGLLLVEDEFGS